MSSEYTIYDLTTGEILRNLISSLEELAYDYDDATEGYVEGMYPEEEYYVTGSPATATARTSFGQVFDRTACRADDTQTATISSLPNPTAYEINQITDSGITSSTGSVTDGSISLKSAITGSVEVILTADTKITHREVIVFSDDIDVQAGVNSLSTTEYTAGISYRLVEAGVVEMSMTAYQAEISYT